MTLVRNRALFAAWRNRTVEEWKPAIVGSLLAFSYDMQYLIAKKFKIESTFQLPKEISLLIYGSPVQGYQLEMRFPDSLSDVHFALVQSIDRAVWKEQNQEIVR